MKIAEDGERIFQKMFKRIKDISKLNEFQEMFEACQNDIQSSANVKRMSNGYPMEYKKGCLKDIQMDVKGGSNKIMKTV